MTISTEYKADHQPPAPVICAVNGVAGAGASIALACDMVLAQTQPYPIFSKIGLVPDAGS